MSLVFVTPNQAVEATSTQRTVSRQRTRGCRVAVGGRASPHRSADPEGWVGRCVVPGHRAPDPCPRGGATLEWRFLPVDMALMDRLHASRAELRAVPCARSLVQEYDR